jgi:hypothetical protein
MWVKGAIVGSMVGLIGMFIPYIGWGFWWIAVWPPYLLGIECGFACAVVSSIVLWMIIGALAEYGGEKIWK